MYKRRNRDTACNTTAATLTSLTACTEHTRTLSRSTARESRPATSNPWAPVSVGLKSIKPCTSTCSFFMRSNERAVWSTGLPDTSRRLIVVSLNRDGLHALSSFLATGERVWHRRCQRKVGIGHRGRPRAADAPGARVVHGVVTREGVHLR